MVLDDLQWADAATVRLLVHLATSVTPARLMVVATYRDAETVGQGPLRAAVAALAREASVTRIWLGGLDETEVAAQLVAVIGWWEVPDSVVAAVCRRTRGNPFFVRELARLLVSSTDVQLPHGVRDAVATAQPALTVVSRRCRRGRRAGIRCGPGGGCSRHGHGDRGLFRRAGRGFGGRRPDRRAGAAVRP